MVGKSLVNVQIALILGAIFYGALEVITSGALSIPSALLQISFDAACATILGILISAVIFITGKRVTLAALALTAIFLWLLKPLFIGHAMVLVFTVPQTIAIAFTTALLLFSGLHVILKLLLADAVEIVNRAIHFLFATLVCLFFIRLNSIFLVRLWGFATMEYLQIASIVITLLIAAAPFSAIVRLSYKGIFLVWLLSLGLWAGSWSLLLPQADNVATVSAKFPNSSLALTSLSHLFDWDGDGFSSLFGFGDCSDHDPKINPRAVDWPNNGKDENCFGGDIKQIAFPAFNTPINVTAPLEQSKRRQIVLLLAIDTLRADFVNYETTGNTITPNLAQVASESVRYSNAYAQSNNTLESFPFVLHLGYRNLPGYNRDWTLASLLKKGGVDSAAVLQASVDKWWSGDLDSALFDFDRVLRGEPTTRSRDARETANLALSELRRPTKRDTFLFLHFEDLHDYFTQNMEGSRIVNMGVNVSELMQLWHMNEMVNLMQQRYRAVLTKLDQAVGIIWSGIKELEKSADVTLIVFSDHGEEFNEHGGLFHMGTLYEELLRVPLFIYRTGGTVALKSDAVTLYQLPATVLDALHFEGGYIKKTSLFSPDAIPPDRFALFSLQERDDRRSFSLIDGDLKFIYDQERNRVMLFDLKADPHELHSVADDPAYADARLKLTQRMDALMFYMNYGDQELVKQRGKQID